MKKLLDWAHYYYKMGFNVTHIVPSKNQHKKYPYKAPTNDRQLITNRRQSISELLDYEWYNSTGIGMVLGREDIRAIDIDHSTLLKNNSNCELSDLSPIINDFLMITGLPKNYAWVVQTPSKGYHVIIKTSDLPFNVDVNPLSSIGENKTKGFVPNKSSKRRFPSLGHFDMRWNLHLTLPPSIDEKGRYYRFVNGSPTNGPYRVEIKSVMTFLKKYCLQEGVNKNESGYNLVVDDYYRNHIYTDFKTIFKDIF